VDNQTTINSAKAGQSVPVKWRLTDSAGNPISDPNSFYGLTSVSTTCGSFAATSTDAIETYTGSSGLQYLGNGYWQYNWATQNNYANSCRVLTLKVRDGQGVPLP
jgi:hypothetical protein